ncbi:hypothetical protein [Telluribacter humicola]|uniref:hypothetical protein n=1 Tax=Telluribacter humicola TaxID=1720261 RepID=UPI001A96E54E|nr:hypothetical protein [Telluribacter humicola]
MKAYNEVLLKNRWVRKRVRDWTAKNLISEEAERSITREYTEVPYIPHWFVWIGLFVFSLISISAGAIFFLPFADLPGSENYFPPLYGLGLFYFLNYLIKDRKLYFSGIDNALLYAIVLSFLPPVLDITSAFDTPPWLVALLYLPFPVFFTYRYGEPVIALGTYLTGLYVLASLAMESPWGKLLLPFLVMIYAGLVWLYVHRFRKRDESFYWKVSLNWVHMATLILFYAAGNYLVVREGNAMINSIYGPSPQIAFAGLFWLLTFTIPVLYLFAALRWKKLSFLVVGSLALVASLGTLHHYHPILPGEWALPLLGLVGFGTAISLMRWLKVPRNGFIYALEKDLEIAVLTRNIVAMQVAGDLPQPQSGPEFGGGDFGGGGSGAAY